MRAYLVRVWHSIDSLFQRLADATNPYDPEKLAPSSVKPFMLQESQIKKRTLQVLLLLFGAFLLWSMTAPMDAGVHIKGKVIVSGKRKEVAHPSGGVVLAIHVKEGDHVKEGQTLISINPLGTEANLNEAELEYINALANESRLLADRDELPEIRWSPDLLKFPSDDPRRVQAMSSQQQVFASARAERQQQFRILSERLTNMNAQLRELLTVLDLKKQQLATLTEEAANIKTLAKEGYVPLATANEVERQKNNILSSISQSVTAIADTQTHISAAQLETVQLRATISKNLNEQLTSVQKAREGLAARVQSLRFDRALAEVKAPASGVVVGLKPNTVGGVIRGSEVLMEIVPDESKLIVEAQVPPVFIDKVRKGMDTSMRFTAFNVKTTPKIDGVITLVGADLLPAQSQVPEHYLAMVETTAAGLEKLEGLEVQPGMPVDLVVKNGERTFMSYLLKPLTDSLAVSFKD